MNAHTLPRSHFSRSLPLRCCLFVVLLLATRAARGGDKFWDSFFSGAFNAGANWNGGVPGANDVAHFGVTTNPLAGASYTVDFDVDPVNQYFLVEDDRVTFDLNGHTYTMTSTTSSKIGTVLGRSGRLTVTDGMLRITNGATLEVGSLAGASGFLTVSTGGTLTGLAPNYPDLTVGALGAGTATVDSASAFLKADVMTIGSGATGTLNVTNGGKAESNTCFIGYDEGVTGMVTVDGAGSKWTNSGLSLFVGVLGNGSLSITGGGLVESFGTSISGADGMAEVDGAGSQWNNTDYLDVGIAGTGTLNITDGGVVHDRGSALGAKSGGMGTVLVDGAGSQWINDETLSIGIMASASGTLNISGGGTVESDGGSLGVTTTTTGEVNVDGVGSQWTSSSTLTIGGAGSGTMNITAGGTVESDTASFTEATIGELAGSDGAVTVTGPGSTWTHGGDLFVGGLGAATLWIEDGGVVSNLEGKIGLESGPMNTVTVTGDGSTWTNSADLAVGDGGNGTLNILAGGAVSSLDTQIAQQMGSEGHVVVSGAGSTWTITGRLGVGGTAGDVNDGGTGTLEVLSGGIVDAQQDIVIFPDGTVQLHGGTLSTTTINFQGSGGQFDWTAGILHIGTFNGDLLNQGGTLAPGHSAGSTTIDGNYQQQSGSTLEIEVGGIAPGVDHDVVTVTGTADLGGQLQLATLPGFTPSTNQRFHVLSATTDVSGEFSNVANGQWLRAADDSGAFLVHYGPDSAFSHNQIVLSHFQPGTEALPNVNALWTFEAGTPGNPPSASGTDISSISPAIGSGTASGHHASSSTTWNNSNGNDSAESFSANNWAVGDYYEFEISTVDLADIQLTFDQRTDDTGPSDWRIAYSTTGDSFTDTGFTYSTVPEIGAWSSFSFDLSSISELNDQSMLFLRLVVNSNISTGGGTVMPGGTSRLDNVTFLGTAILPGDYNGNGVIDAADYSTWRDALTAGSTTLANDPTPGRVDESDFLYWRDHFGETIGSGTGAGAAAVPEPATLSLLLLGSSAIIGLGSPKFLARMR